MQNWGQIAAVCRGLEGENSESELCPGAEPGQLVMLGQPSRLEELLARTLHQLASTTFGESSPTPPHSAHSLIASIATLLTGFAFISLLAWPFFASPSSPSLDDKIRLFDEENSNT